jgi:hypothetical protein
VTGVRRTRRGVVVTFDEVEASLLRHLVGEVRELLVDGEEPPAVPVDRRPGPAAAPAGGLPTDAELQALTGMGEPADGEAPGDPALARLLPDAYRDDPGAAGEFRGVQDACVGQQADAGALGGVDDVAVLRHAPAQVVGGDQKHAADAGKGSVQRVRAVVVRDPGSDAERRQRRGRLAAADGDGDPVGGHRRKQLVHDQTAELAAGPGDEQLRLGMGHGCAPYLKTRRGLV